MSVIEPFLLILFKFKKSHNVGDIQEKFAPVSHSAQQLAF
jgi:hypothetical protein